jgi:glycosyltransferase involved in cell wall biosynthesis
MNAPASPRREGSPLRVLIVGPVAPPFGGMSVQGELLERKLRASGVNARRILTNRSAGAFGSARVASALVRHSGFMGSLPRAVAWCDLVHVLATSWQYFFARVAASIVVARSLGRRVIVNYRAGDAEEFFERQGRQAEFFVRRAHALMVPSAFLARVFAKRGLMAVEVPNIADLDRFPFRARDGLAPRILVNRNFGPIYNVALAIDAFVRIRQVRPDATLTLAGTGPLENDLRAQAERLGSDGITFVGPVDNALMAALYDAHAVYLNPSDVDNMPVSILESMAAGLAVVSTNAGGIPDLVGDGDDGLLVPARDPDHMAWTVLSLLSDAELSRRLIEAGFRKAQSFGWEEVWRRLRNVYIP